MFILTFLWSKDVMGGKGASARSKSRHCVVSVGFVNKLKQVKTPLLHVHR